MLKADLRRGGIVWRLPVICRPLDRLVRGLFAANLAVKNTDKENQKMRKTVFRSIYVILLIVLLTTIVIGCGARTTSTPAPTVKPPSPADSYPVTVTDGLGNTVTLEKAPQRIVSLSPANTEILFALNAGDRVVGVTDYCNYPKEALQKEKVGGFANPSVEKILSLKPDLVVAGGFGDQAVFEKLKEANIPVIRYEAASINAVVEEIKGLGQVLDKEDAAEKLSSAITAKRDEIAGKVKNAPAIALFFEISPDLWTVGPGSFIQEIITVAGGENIAADAGAAYAQYSKEKLLEKNPEVYLSTSGDTAEMIAKREGFGSLKAVQNHKVYTLDPDIFSRPGPRVIEAMEQLARLLHPDLF